MPTRLLEARVIALGNSEKFAVVRRAFLVH